MRKVLESAVILLGTMGWWGFVYPELCLLDVSYEYEEASDFEEADDMGSGGTEDMYAGARSEEDKAEPSDKFEVVVNVPAWEAADTATERKVRIKSKMAEYVYQVRSRQAEKEIQDDE